MSDHYERTMRAEFDAAVARLPPHLRERVDIRRSTLIGSTWFLRDASGAEVRPEPVQPKAKRTLAEAVGSDIGALQARVDIIEARLARLEAHLASTDDAKALVPGAYQGPPEVLPRARWSGSRWVPV